MTPHDRVDTIINDAASRMTNAKPSDALRAGVMSRIAVERPWRFPWRFVFAGGAIASVAVVAFVLLKPAPSPIAATDPAIANLASSTPTRLKPTLLNPAILTPSRPTDVPRASSPRMLVERTAVTMSDAEREWRERATPALDRPEALEVKPLELRSIDITPLDVAPLVVPALGDGSNR